MLYLAYDAQADLMNPMRQMASLVLGGLGSIGWRRPDAGWPGARHAAAAYELIERAGLTHVRPDFDIKTVKTGNRQVAVTEQVALKLPFGTLVHFKKDVETPQPPVLVVAPLSGHFATLLRNTALTLLSDHDVYITDWANARDIPASQGKLGFDEYVTTLIRFMEKIGPDAHVVAVCQPCVQTLAAVAVMAEDRNACQPRTMTLMAGPVDTRINPTEVNKLATGKPIDWFRRNLIARVPARYPGAGRKVYPGFVQLTAFMSMNLQRHIKAHSDLYDHIVAGDIEKAMAIKTFYDEYFAVLDLPAEFYLETVEWIFQEMRLATGKLTYQGRKIDCRAIKRTALLTVEGERDDICSVGQTAAAHDLCGSIKPFMKRHHLQAGVGHYGVFSGRKWEGQIYPIVRNHILSMS